MVRCWFILVLVALFSLASFAGPSLDRCTACRGGESLIPNRCDGTNCTEGDCEVLVGPPWNGVTAW